jgi:S-methylmethionine-dependent homocysteine/selenocysteine methylase
MAKYRHDLPQLNGNIFLTDGGLETTLIFHNGLDLPEFAAFDLLKDGKGYETLYKYFSLYAAISREYCAGFILESPTWRASSAWGEKLGYSDHELVDMNRKAIKLLRDVRDEYETEKSRMVISGCMGSRGDGYNMNDKMSEEEAERYHAAQIETFRETDADMVSALTMTHTEEAIGLTRAARSEGMPVVISFTVETDGKLPSGEILKDAIEKVDNATDNTPVYYMLNCAHPAHIGKALDDGSWMQRVRGIRANASAKSHAELDEAVELDDGNPQEFGSQHNELINKLDHLNVFGGCCGTDHRHVVEIAKTCVPGLEISPEV